MVVLLFDPKGESNAKTNRIQQPSYVGKAATGKRSFATACCDVELVVRLLLHRIHALLLHIQLVVDVLVIRVAISIQKCECNAQNNGDVIQWLVCGVIPLLHHKKHVFDIKTES
eukprot:616288_1